MNLTVHWVVFECCAQEDDVTEYRPLVAADAAMSHFDDPADPQQNESYHRV
jgi:hypothetical protein